MASVLVLTGCKPNVDGLAIALSAISGASSVAIAVATSLESTESISPETAQRIVTYSQTVSNATSQAIAELRSTDSKQQKALKIAAIFAAVPRVVLAEHDPKAVAVMRAIEAAIQALIVQLESSAKVPGGTTVTLTREQASELARIERQARETYEYAALWSERHR